MKPRRAIWLVSAAVVLAGCQPITVKPTDSAGPPPAIRTGMLVTAKWLAENLDNPSLVLIHVGQHRFGYDLGHIPGARFVSHGELAVTRDGIPNELPASEDMVNLVRRLGATEHSRLVIYDEETGLWAARAFVVLDYLGLGDRAALLDGQLKKWQEEKRPVQFTEPTTTVSAFTPRTRPQVLVPLSAMRELVAGKQADPKAPVAIIDARPQGQYEGTEAGSGITRPGHIPTAVNLFWMRNIVSEDNPVLRPVPELRAIYQQAGAGPKSQVVAYCRTGGQASYTYFTARYLGYDVRLYDGSFWEWSQAEDTPVEAASAATQPGSEGTGPAGN